MTLGQKIAWDDTVLPFQLDRSNIRGRVARLDGVLEQILSQHNYPVVVAAMVAEAAMLTALIGQTIKLRWKLSLQIRGDGPIRLIATDYFAPSSDGKPARIRAYASFDPARLDDNAPSFAQIGKGFFAILIDQGNGMTPYQGITPLAGGSLSDCAGTYFAQSEQLPSKFAITYGRNRQSGDADESWRGGGVMIQHMPKASPLMRASDDMSEGGSEASGLVAAQDIPDTDEAEDWNRVSILLDTVEEFELIGPSLPPTELLRRLFHEEEPVTHEAQTVRFGCTCSPDKVRQSMSIYSARDLAHMTLEDGTLTADCQFCGAHYVMDPKELGFEAENGAD